MISKIAVLLAVVAVTLAQYDGHGRRDGHKLSGYGGPVHGGLAHGYKAPVHGGSVHGYKAPVHGYDGPAKHSLRPAYSADAPTYKKDDYESPKPYQFGFNTKDEYNTELHREESGDEYGNVKGSYGYVDGYGIYRQVEYTADEYGFKAQIKTNEPGTASQNPADVEIYADPAPVKYDAPKKGYKDGHKASVAHSGSYAAPVYGQRAAHVAPGYGNRAAHVAPGYGHRAAHAAPGYGRHATYAAPAVHKTAHASTHRRGYDKHGNGYGHASHVATHKIAPVHHGYAAPVHHGYAAPVAHKAAHVSTHRRGYDAHGNGYGHDSHVSTHKVHH